MLKLHHMNLLQELHETTMMMNMYQQQQQLQQEQLRIQQAQTDQQLLNPMGSRRGSLGAGMDPLFGGGGLAQRGSLGLGIGPRGSLGLGNMAGFGPRGSLGLGTTGGLKSQLDARIGGMKSELDAKDTLGASGFKRGMDGSGSGDRLKRQKLDGDPNA